MDKVNLKKNYTTRIKVAICADNLYINGISSVIMNYCKKLNLSRFDITVIVGSPIADIYHLECNKLGIAILKLPARKRTPIKYYMALNKVFSNTVFDIIHVHGNSSTMFAELLIAWKNGVKHRIAHCHTSLSGNMRRHNLLMPLFKRLYTTGLACSTLAGDWIFGQNKFFVVKNGFETGNFRFDPFKRSYYRKKLCLENKLVVGHVGRFNAQKNHMFLIKAFECAAQKTIDLCLLLVGDGPDIKTVRQYAKKSKYSDRIIFYGESNKIPDLLSAMDIFAFPSKSEGLGIVALEAQISGLDCIVSEAVPKDVVLGNKICFLPVTDESIGFWANKISSTDINTNDRQCFYDHHKELILEYDINESVKELEQIYENIVSSN